MNFKVLKCNVLLFEFYFFHNKDFLWPYTVKNDKTSLVGKYLFIKYQTVPRKVY